MIESVEDIPDGDAVCRLVFFPHMYNDAKALIWKMVFSFPNGNCESVVWKRYAREPEDAHRLGRELETTMRQKIVDRRYTGFVSAIVGAIREIQTPNGHGFAVNHAPDEGRHHVEICFASAGQIGVVKLKPSEKAELKAYLEKVFDELVANPL